jgi:cold-inducible RNA-binding protein
MGRKLLVGNLDPQVTDVALSKVFDSCGTVRSAEIACDRFTGVSRGFALVEMASDDEARRAIRNLHLKEIDGRCMTVQEERPRTGGPGKRGRR